MAKSNTYGQDGYPIPHTNFKGAIDTEFINPNLIPVDILKECTNLTPFRRAGSLQQCPGHDRHLTPSNLPTVVGYKLVDFYVFQVDRDSKEITMLIYKDSPHTRTRIFINPWYNPADTYINNDSNFTDESWISGWLELTEKYTGTIQSVSTGAVVVNSYPANAKGWFIVNKTMESTNLHQKYTMVVSSSTSTLNLFASTSGWTSGDEYELVRFPVVHLYDAPTNGSILNTSFKPTVTDFQAFGNELRIACGKDDRPLILEMLKDKKYFEEQISAKGIDTLTLTNRGQYYYQAANITELLYGDAPTISFSGGTTPASAYCTMRLNEDVSTKLTIISGTYTNGKTYIEDSGALDSIRIRAFQCEYDGTDLNITDPGEYRKIIPTKFDPVAPDPPEPFEITVVELPDSGAYLGGSGKVQIDRMEIANVYITNSGVGYTAPVTVTFTADADTTKEIDPTATVTLTSDTFEMSYDGLWFDFEQVPQLLLGSQTTAFDKPTVFSSSTYYWSPSIGFSIAIGNVKFILKGQRSLKLTLEVSDDVGTGVHIEGNEVKAYFEYDSGTTYADFHRVMYQVGIGDYFDMFILCDPALDFQTTSKHSQVFARGDGLDGVEADGNDSAKNIFLGMDIKVDQVEDTHNADKYAYILTAQVGRNEVIVGHGFWRPGNDDSTDAHKGIWVNFGTWFSRRLLGFNLYNKKTYTIDSGAGKPFTNKLNKDVKYPYFKYDENINYIGETSGPMNINEIPHFSSYSIDDFKRQIGTGSISPYNQSLNNIDNNTYHLDKTNGVYFIKMYDDKWGDILTPSDLTKKYTGVGTNGIGLKFIVKCNRYIDQDITMNYTKSAFVGQTNGRRFLVGCKNIVENEVLENGDMIYPNNYAVGVSQYDTFLRDGNIIANVGDTDIVRDIQNFRGYLVIVKDTNIYALDVNTDDELKYRVVDTMVGRGTKFTTACCSTPYGIVVPTYDGVWIMSPNGVEPIMTSSNAKLTKWKTAIADSQAIINSVYYNDYNEVMIFITRTDSENGEATDVFTFNFQYKMWTYYNYYNTHIEEVVPNTTPKTYVTLKDATVVRKVRTNSTKEVLMLNQKDVSRSITGATKNTSPSTVVTVTSAGHRLSVGQSITISGVVGMTDLNGTFTVATVATNSFTVALVTTQTWSSGGTIYRNDENIIKLSETSSDFYDYYGYNYYIPWRFGTHNMPYGTRLKNILMAWLTLEFGYSSSASCDLTITPYYNGTAGTPFVKTITSSSSAYVEDVCKDMMNVLQPIANSTGVSAFGFTVTNGSKLIKFNLNAFYTWITVENRVPQL